MAKKHLTNNTAAPGQTRERQSLFIFSPAELMDYGFI